MICPVCQLQLDVVEDWPLGKISRCPTGHFQRTEDYDNRSVQMDRIQEAHGS